MPLSVAFLWHLHQPPYKDPLSGRWILPWVRLHALKDYYDMAAILKEVPGIALNFNFSPCLLTQIEAYASGQADEVLGEIAYKPTSLLSEEERAFLIREGFQANPRTLIEPHARYRELLLKRGRRIEGGVSEILARFSEQDIRDLQVWSQLAWFDPWAVSQDPELESLIVKGEGFAEEDKRLLRNKEQGLLGKILPLYRELSAEGKIELTTSPFYHPILPLLIDSDVARQSSPQLRLPPRFTHPEDARYHLEKAVLTFQDLLGVSPRGLWPSEGAVSEALVPIVSRAGFEWMATDEDILRLSLPDAGKLSPRDLYDPWSVGSGEGRVSILFRDRTLSDLIGFEYSRWPAKDAAQDFLNRLKEIQARTEGTLEEPFVLVALDGENAWEYYPGDGRDFLLALYRALSEERDIRIVKISDHLREHPPDAANRSLHRLHPGSWINHDFSTWAGSEAHTRAWSLLSEARETLERAQGSSEAWESLYAAEGSDWYWWYSGRHMSTHLAEFDLLFRNHLTQAYKQAGFAPPAGVYEPIVRAQEVRRGPDREPTGIVHPVLDGRVTDYFEWQGAGRYDLRWGGAMPYSRGLLTEFLYGADRENLYLALGLARLSPEERQKLTIVLEAVEPTPLSATLFRDGTATEPCAGAMEKILELRVPYMALGIEPGGSLSFFLVLSLDGEEERYPQEPALIQSFDMDESQWMA